LAIWRDCPGSATAAPGVGNLTGSAAGADSEPRHASEPAVALDLVCTDRPFRAAEAPQPLCRQLAGRPAIVAQMTIEPRLFRNALGCFATGVTVVTARSPAGEPVGVTVNSFNSVSLDPPLILFSIDRAASSYPVFRDAVHYVVNVLCDSQRELSQRFARSVGQRWDDVPHATWDSGVPVLIDCLANLECAREAVYEGGDHVILLGRVLTLAHREDGRPLLYYRGAYRGLGD